MSGTTHTLENFRKYLGDKIKNESAFTAAYTGDTGHTKKKEKADSVVFPKSIEDLQKAVYAANKLKLNIIARGGGTSMPQYPNSEFIVVDLKGMSRLVYMDAKQGTALFEAGIFIPQLQNILNKKGFMAKTLHWDFSRTLGGILSTGGVDLNSFKMGCLKNHTRYIEVMTPSGDIVHCSNKENRELFQLVLGGYGQYGIITKACIEIEPLSESFFSFDYSEAPVESSIEYMLDLAGAELPDYMVTLILSTSSNMLVTGFNNKESQLRFEEKSQERTSVFPVQSKSRWLKLRPSKGKESPLAKERKENLFSYFEKIQENKKPMAYSKDYFFFELWRSLDINNGRVFCSVEIPVEKLEAAFQKIRTISYKYFPESFFSIMLLKNEESDSGMSIKASVGGESTGIVNIFMQKSICLEHADISACKERIYDKIAKLGGRPFGCIGKNEHKAIRKQAHYNMLKEKKSELDTNNILNSEVIF